MWLHRPDAFDGLEHEATPERPWDDGWSFPEAGIPFLRVHPAHIVTEEALTLVRWQAAMEGGMGGSGPLPFSGGLAEQPAGVMAAFRLIAATVARLPKKPAG